MRRVVQITARSAAVIVKKVELSAVASVEAGRKTLMSVVLDEFQLHDVNGVLIYSVATENTSSARPLPLLYEGPLTEWLVFVETLSDDSKFQLHMFHAQQ